MYEASLWLAGDAGVRPSERPPALPGHLRGRQAAAFTGKKPEDGSEVSARLCSTHSPGLLQGAPRGPHNSAGFSSTPAALLRLEGTRGRLKPGG